MKLGYKQMLRDRMPFVIDLALRWCNAKGRWIDHVYANTIKKYPQDKRGVIVKMVLGLKQQYTRMEIHDYFKYVKMMPVTKEMAYSIPKDDLFIRFEDTINWDACDDEMRTYWKTIVDWVKWFRTCHIPIKSMYENSLSFGNDEETTKLLIMSKFKINRKLTDYIINSFK